MVSKSCLSVSSFNTSPILVFIFSIIFDKTTKSKHITGFAKLTLLGTWQQTGYKGRMRADWVVLLNGTQVTVRHVQTGYSDTSILLFADDGASGRFPLLQSDFEAIIVAPGVVVPQRWDILHRDALSQDLGLVLDDLTNMSAASQIALFGTSSAEPYASFRNLFEHGKILPLRLSGVLLALAYRMEAVRNP